MNVIPHVSLPVSGSGIGDICLICSGGKLTIKFEYCCDRKDLIGMLCFYEPIAYRFKNETHSRGFISSSYDCVVEVQDSSWLQELASSTPVHMHGVSDKCHFAVFLSNNGFVEVIAKSVALLTPSEGIL